MNDILDNSTIVPLGSAQAITLRNIRYIVIGIVVVVVVSIAIFAAFFLIRDSLSSCEYNNVTYLRGDSFEATDGCNTCTCKNWSVSCTKLKCYSCAVEGTVLDPDHTVACCGGLVEMPNNQVSNGGCLAVDADITICLRCGDGICDKYENSCNCEEDCIQPSRGD